MLSWRTVCERFDMTIVDHRRPGPNDAAIPAGDKGQSGPVRTRTTSDRTQSSPLEKRRDREEAQGVG
jgi:hypothetical protein